MYPKIAPSPPSMTSYFRASPRLKDAKIPASEYPSLYEELVLNMRRMYHRCKLVHADLSEYNILYHDAHLYVIDVSQSVEHDHPHAFDFLRSDIKNVEEFFGRFGVKCLGLRRCFEFVTRDRLEDSGTQDHDGDVLQRWITETGEPADDSPQYVDGSGDAKGQTADEDSVFLRSYIPRTLNEVYDPERDIDVLKGGEGRKLIYADTIGLVDSPSAGAKEDEVHHDYGESPESDSESTSDEEAEEEGQGPERRALRGHRHEDREAKKVCGGSRHVGHQQLSLVRRNERRQSRRKHGKSGNTRCPKRKRSAESKIRVLDIHHDSRVIRSTCIGQGSTFEPNRTL